MLKQKYFRAKVDIVCSNATRLQAFGRGKRVMLGRFGRKRGDIFFSRVRVRNLEKKISEFGFGGISEGVSS